jgi:type VI protein secretion system component VasF
MADADAEPKPADQAELVADIDRTRAELARTIDAISDRVSPKKNATRAMDRARERLATIDPVLAGAAAAAVAVSVTALIMYRVRRGRRDRKR